MKKINKNIYCAVDFIKVTFIFIMLFLAIPMIADYNDTHYFMNGEIYSVFNNEIIVLDTTGNLWSFEASEYTGGEKVKILFYTNHTDTTRKDDIIIKIKQKKY